MPDLDLRLHAWRPLPATDAKRSMWIQDAMAGGAELSPPLAADADADVCIVGGGFTGLWTAIRLREQDPARSVLVLEADFCGAGASGRNSGATGNWWGKLPTLLRLLGPEQARQVLDASTQAVQEIEAFVAEHAIACELRRGQTVWAATAPAQAGAWEGCFAAAARLQLQAPWQPLDTARMRELFGAAPFLDGVLSARALRLQPALLARGLRRAALALGVAVHERTPVARITSQGGPLRVQTPQGAVTCRQLVLAANAWMAHLPEFRPHIAVVSSDIVATGRIAELLAQRGLAGRPDFINARLMLNYGGTTPDGRVFVGRGGGTVAFGNRVGAAFDHSERQLAEVADDFRFLHPGLADQPLAHGWSGPVDRSVTGLPWFGALERHPQVFYGIGYSGHGVGASALGGQVLASLLLGRTDRWAAVAAALRRARQGRFPPEPVRTLGAHLVRNAVARKERAEREGRQPSALDVALARLAPGTIAEVRKR